MDKKHAVLFSIAVIAFSGWTYGIWLIGVGWGSTKEQLVNQQGMINSLIEQRTHDMAAYGIIDRAKAEKVAICVQLKGKNCDETTQ